MYLNELWASCRRRWKILVVLLAISAGLCWVAASQVKPTYEARATLVLVPPESVENPETNRYLDLGSLTDSVDVLARSMGSAETVDALERQAPGAEYEVMADETTSAPILLVTATAPDEQASSSMQAAVMDRVEVNLAKLQKSIGIEQPYQITLMTLSKDPEPKASQSGRVRVLGALSAGLLLGCGLLTAALDGVLLRRRDREAQASGHGRPEKHAADKAGGGKTATPKGPPPKGRPPRTVPPRTVPPKTVPPTTVPAKTNAAKTVPPRVVPAKTVPAKTGSVAGEGATVEPLGPHRLQPPPGDDVAQLRRQG
jgi:hypothetical protein